MSSVASLPVIGQPVREALGVLFGEHVSFRKTDRLAYHRDLMPGSLLTVREGEASTCPDAIVWPQTVQDIVALLALANEHKFPIVPYGAGSSVVGAAIPIRGGVICDLKRKARLVRMDEKSLLYTAEAGILGEDLERKLNAAGFTCGHFPSSMYCSTLGGWLAMRSAGQMSTRYGKIEDLVVSLEAVLPSGQVIQTRNAPRSATGPDIDQLLVGSEGTLGVITRATLRMFPLPETRRFASAVFATVEQGLEAVRSIMRIGCRPAVVRLYDEVDTALALSSLGLDVTGNLLILGYEGRERIVSSELAASHEALADGRDLGEEPGKWWFEHRYKISYKQSIILANDRMVLDTLEVAATWTRVLDVYAAVKKALEGYVTVLAHFSHAYPEGINIYFSFVGHAGETRPVEFHQEMWRRALGAVAESGGSISHHHGIGLLKAPWLKRELGGLHEAFVAFKAELDPNNILNPGKMGLP
jgi:alkyldihydroxyacetonephosphate synthase